MKTKKKLLLALLSATCLTAGAFGLVACSDDTTEDNRDQQIVAVYNQYVATAGENALSYEDWLNSIKGADGKDGTNGTNGKDGATWLTGAGAPAATLGKEGDLYLDTDEFDIYKKGATAWEKTGNIKGQDGTSAGKGDKGDAGATWLSGEDAPAADKGKQGDFYIDSKTFDVYLKGESGWAWFGNIKGAAGKPGDPGAAGVGIAEIEINKGNLVIWLTDEEADPITIALPAEVTHTHDYYGDNEYKGVYYDAILISPTFENEGLAYIKCIEDGCPVEGGHMELVALPKLTGDGKDKLDPIDANKIIKEDGSVEVPQYKTSYGYFEDAYFKYTVPKKGYVVVSTEKQSWDTSCMFHVYTDSEYADELYSHTEIGDDHYYNDVHFEAGTVLYIEAVADDFAAEDGKYYISINFYDETTTQKHTVTLLDGETPIPNVPVQAYSYSNNNKYQPIEGKKVNTNDKGEAIFDLPVGSYYFGTEFPEGAGFADVKPSTTSKIGLDFSFATTLKPLKYEDYTVTVAIGDKKFQNIDVKVTASEDPDDVNAKVVSSGKTDADGKVTLKAVEGQYIHFSGFEGNFVADSEYVYEGENDIAVEPYYLVSFTEDTSSFAAEAGVTYVINSKPSTVYSIATAEGAFIDALRTYYYTYISSGTVSDSYADRFTFVSADGAGAKTKITEVSKLEGYSGYPIQFTVTAATTVTVTKDGPTTLDVTGTNTQNLAAGTYVFETEETKSYTIKVKAQGKYLDAVIVDGTQFVEGGKVDSWYLNYYSDYLSAVYDTENDNNVTEFKINAGAADSVVFTITEGMEIEIVVTDEFIVPVEFTDNAAAITAEAGKAYVVKSEQATGSVVAITVSGEGKYISSVKIGNANFVTDGVATIPADCEDYVKYGYISVTSNADGKVTAISIDGFFISESDLKFEVNSVAEVEVSLTASELEF